MGESHVAAIRNMHEFIISTCTRPTTKRITVSRVIFIEKYKLRKPHILVQQVTRFMNN